MLFFEPLFLFYAFPLFFALYVLLQNHNAARRALLIIGSFAFYCWGEPLFMPVLLLSILADYLIAARIAATGDGPSRRLGWLMVGVACNLAILGFYKYVDFIIQNINVISTPLLGVSLPLLQVVLPIGVSFIVFEKISYLVDVHRGVTPPARTLFDYSLFVLFFPKLLAGPIIKYHEMDPQIRRLAPIKADEVLAGVERFARGLVKKLLLADPLGIFVDQVFGASSELGVGRAWLGLLCFTLQIYFDFSGYSDMAIGLARMLGFRLRENFATPYIAQSMTEFWQRWHISFTTWIRDYLYIPLGSRL
jgi:alginate O-acetyltransferase complex protein AlgI